MSFVWNHFTKIDSKKAKCKLKNCGAVIKILKGTSGMINHLSTLHNIQKETNVLKRPSTEPIAPLVPEKRQKGILTYFKQKTIEEEVAKMVAVSNLTFNQVATCNFIRRSLAKEFPNDTVPKQTSQVVDLLEKYYQFAEEEVKKKIEELKDKQQKFSVSLDEWSSSTNIRYLNMNLHYIMEGEASFFNLGLIKIDGSATADAILEIVRYFLDNFKLYLIFFSFSSLIIWKNSELMRRLILLQ
jgi:BED zinc finger